MEKSEIIEWLEKSLDDFERNAPMLVNRTRTDFQWNLRDFIKFLKRNAEEDTSG